MVGNTLQKRQPLRNDFKLRRRNRRRQCLLESLEKRLVLATTILLDEPQAGSIDSAGEVDTFSLSIDSEDRVGVSLDSRVSDTNDLGGALVQVFDPEGTLLAGSDVLAGNPHLRNVHLAVPGVYTIAVQAPTGDPARTGEYELHVMDRLENEPNGTAETAMTMSPVQDPAGAGVWWGFGFGTIDPAEANNSWSDLDYWSFDALAGDRLTNAVDTPSSDANPYVELRNSAGGMIASNNDGGPGGDSLISNYPIDTSGQYLIAVGKDYHSTIAGEYEVRLELTRGVELESDTNYSNTTIAGGNTIPLTQGAPFHFVGSVVGTIMASEGTQIDEDFFSLGRLDPGNVVELDTIFPAFSTLDAKVVVVDQLGNELDDQDGNPGDGHFLTTIESDRIHYARLMANGGAGHLGQYVLSVDIQDVTPPKLLEVVRLPEEGGVTSQVFSPFSVRFNEQLDRESVLHPDAWDFPGAPR